ncbi:hypothetical protein G6F40_014593 [Rhizopus arrhizus]|nr:hypothetical protein G6F40_014593 [Rhizopus arrhizus]
MAVRAGIGHLLVGTASGQHLPRAAACVLAQERRRRRATPGQAQAAVAGIHHEHHVLGLHALGDVLDVGHRDRVGGELLRVRIHRDDVAKVAPGGELAGRTMAGEEHEHTGGLAGAVVGQAVVEGGQDVVAACRPPPAHRGWRTPASATWRNCRCRPRSPTPARSRW